MAPRIDTRVLDNILRNLKGNRNKVGRRMAFMIEARAKPKTRLDTGALRNSIYVATQEEDGYSVAASAAKTARPGVQTEAHPKPSGNVIAVVGPCVEYAEYQEFGTHKMAAKPYLTPAVEEVGREFEKPENWKELFE